MENFNTSSRLHTDHDETKGFSHETTTRGHVLTCGDMAPNRRHQQSSDGNTMSDFCPHMAETSSAKSSSDDDHEDTFDMDRSPTPSIYNSTIPIVLEVAPRRGFFDSKDPLFNGVCLYNGSMTSRQRHEVEYKGSRDDEESRFKSGRLSWILSSIFSDTT